LNIRDWFLAIYLMGSIEAGARPAQLQKFIGVNHETAVNMARRIRAAMKQDISFVQRCVQLPRSYPGGIDPATPNRNRHPTLHAVAYKFATEEKTREHLARVRWPNGPMCPKCQKPKVRRVQSQCRRNRHIYWCLVCKKQFSVTSGSRDFHGIRNLSEWFIALYLMESSPRGVPPKQMERLLGVNYRTAVSLIEWFRGKEDRRKFLFDFYIGYNDPAEFQAAQAAVKKERQLIKQQQAK
jgi:transposase-like protein